MSIGFPFLTAYDPPGASEGTLDPLGLYQIADQLAVQLVPAVRERMLRIRFLTAMAVGALVTEGLDEDPEERNASPYLVWEWLVVEALVREKAGEPANWGVPGVIVAGRAHKNPGYLDARGYLKTPRVFGFHGVYKRLAAKLGLVDIHLGRGPNAEALADAWARGAGLGGLDDAKTLLSRWTEAVRRSLAERPPRTRPGWDKQGWTDLAAAFVPAGAKTREKRLLRDLLLGGGEDRLGALPEIWDLQSGFTDDEYREEVLHNRLEAVAPRYGSLLGAIRAYEAFARSLQDAFDALKAEAAKLDAQGYVVPEIARDAGFRASVEGLHGRFEVAHRALGEIMAKGLSLPNLFADRFRLFAEPLDARSCALALCDHHEAVQQAKAEGGKRPWFDRLGRDRIYIRHDYREPRRDLAPGRYVHDYRGWPIRRFWRDLA